MYILVVSRGYPTKKYNLNGIFEFAQAKALAKIGCKVVFAAVDVRSIRRWRKWGLEHHYIEGVNVYAINIPVGKMPRIILNIITSIGLNVIYKRILKEFGRPDILHAHFTGVGYAASNLKKRINVPLVITEHSSLIMMPKINRKIFKTAKDAFKHANALIAVSPALVKVIENKFNIKPLYVPNIVDTDLFFYRPRVQKDLFNFVSIGSLTYNKRMDLTIAAFYNAFRDFTNVRLTIFGEGKERPKLESLIEKYNLKTKVIFEGICKQETIAKKLRESDCFVLPSKSETFGVAYIEALACGVPIIATKCGGPEVFVNKSNGLLIPVNDVDTLAVAMKYMYKNITLFDKKKIAKDIKSKFSPEVVANQLLRIYKKIGHIE
jgi:L-malate glycosyltransferase